MSRVEVGRAAAAKLRWPGSGRRAQAAALAGGTVAGSPSMRHAENAWADAGRAAVAQCQRAQSATLAEMAMVGALASHLGACERCWRTGPYDSRTPASWLMWAVAKRPGMAGVAGPILASVAGRELSRELPAPEMR